MEPLRGSVVSKHATDFVPRVTRSTCRVLSLEVTLSELHFRKAILQWGSWRWRGPGGIRHLGSTPLKVTSLKHPRTMGTLADFHTGNKKRGGVDSGVFLFVYLFGLQFLAYYSPSHHQANHRNENFSSPRLITETDFFPFLSWS